MRIKMKRLLGILLALAMVIGMMPVMSMTVYAESDSYDSYSFSYMGDCQRSPAYPVKGDTFNGSGIWYAEDQTALQGTYTVTYKGLYGAVKDVLSIPSYYGYMSEYNLSDINKLPIYELKYESTTKYGSIVAVSSDKKFALFLDSHDSGFLLSNDALSEHGSKTFVVDSDLNSIIAAKDVAVTGVTIAPHEAEAKKGDVIKLTATVSPDNAADKTVKWSVGGTNAGAVKLYTDEACTTEVGADATKTLVVYAKGISAGSATVTVTSNAEASKKAECAVTINKASAVAATVNANNRTYDGTEKPLVTVTGEVTGGTMQYALGTDATTAPDASVYTTDIPAKTNAGTYYVWYKAVGDNDHADSEAAVIEVTISEKAVTPEVKFDVTTMDLKSGQIGTIAVTVEPSDAVVTWSSDKETVATVDNTGKVTAVGAGTAKITATITVAGTQYKAECTVTVQEEPVTPEVKFDVTTMDLKSGQTGTMAVTVEPSDAVVTWSSDKETVATVDNTGKVTAVGAGTAKITATITVAGTQYKAECTVTVQEEPVTPEVKFDVSTMDLKSGQTGTIAVTVEPSDAVVTWSSDKETVATVDDEGKVTATGAGTAAITATITIDGTEYKAQCTVTVTEDASEDESGDTVIDKEGSAPDDQKAEVENDTAKARDIVSGAAGEVDESDLVRLILKTDSVDESGASGETKEAVDAIKGAVQESGMIVGRFVDLSLIFVVEDANGNRKSDGSISETSSPLSVRFPIPEDLRQAGRIFYVLRFHGSSVDVLGSGSGDAVDVSTDKFSIYAIAYKDGTPEEAEITDNSEKAHIHTFAWDTRNATADTDGEMRYQCTKCGMIQTRVPISAYYIFNKETTEKIRAAKQGETVKIETRRWISFHKMVAEALAERKDVTVEVSFLDQGHKGNPYIFTIPAGTDLTPLFDESGFAGFMYLGNKFGMTAEGN